MFGDLNVWVCPRLASSWILFQSDYDSWVKWNRILIQRVQNERNEDGSIGSSSYGKSYSTGNSLLALALNYRLLPVYER